MSDLGDVWVIAGAPGAGKSYFAERFVRRLLPSPALIDKDTMYNQLIDSVLLESGRPIGERESDWYNTHIKPHTYDGMSAIAREVRENGCGVVLSAPYTEALYVAGEWDALVRCVGGGTVRLVWIRTDPETLQFRLSNRGYARDADKLATFDAYAGAMNLEEVPIPSHIEIDNRLSAPNSVELQLAAVIDGAVAPE